MQLRWAGVGLVAVQEGVVGSEWVESRLGALVQEATAAPGDGGRRLVLGEPVPSCRRRHGYGTETSNSCEPAIRAVYQEIQ